MDVKTLRGSDLQFGSAAQGDPSLSVSPASSFSAHFTLTGAPNETYRIFLPTSPVLMRVAGGVLEATQFQSIPSGTGHLDGNGNGTIDVGATRADISPTQATGNYSGSFMIGVQSSTGGPTSQARSTARQTVIASLAISKLANLDFGAIAPGDPSRRVDSAAPAAARFVVSGERNRLFSIHLPQSVILRHSNGATMSVRNLLSTPGDPGNLGPSGSVSLSVGGILPGIPAQQPAGSYVGLFTVTVVYQ